MKDDENLDDDLAPPAKTSKLVIILLALNLVAGGLAAFKAMTASTAPAAAAEADQEPSDVPGPLYSFDPFVVNLNNPENARFLKVTIDAELTDAEVEKKLDDSHVRIARDGVMRYLSSLTMKEVMGEAAKDTIATEIVSRLNKALGENQVKRILFAEFVVQ